MILLTLKRFRLELRLLREEQSHAGQNPLPAACEGLSFWQAKG
jgi:hypothetical protein